MQENHTIKSIYHNKDKKSSFLYKKLLFEESLSLQVGDFNVEFIHFLI